MRIVRNAAFSAVILVVVVAAGWVVLEMAKVRPIGLATDPTYQGGPFTGNYRNDTYRFALKMPEGFSAGELPADEYGGIAVVLQDSEGNGLQIYIVPAGSDAITLTEADIRSAIPGIQIRDAEVIEIGAEHRGVAFLSDNDAFGGDSREVWFYFRGNLYQISTYARLDPLLKAMFATWEFY